MSALFVKESFIYGKQNTWKKHIVLPLIAAVLSLPVIPIYLGVLDWELPGFILVYMIVSLIAGFITGIISLSGDKKLMGRIGLIATSLI